MTTHKDLDALPLPELTDRVLRNAEVIEFIRAAHREGYELAMREAQAYFDTLPLLPEGGVPVDVYNEAMQSLEKAVEERDALREAQEGREPVARVELMTTGGNVGIATRIVEIDDPLRERLRPGALLYDYPPPKSDEARDAERYRITRRGQHWSVVNGIGDTLRGDALDAAADAALAAQQKGGAA